MTTTPAGVVIAAGGLGTRVSGWSPLLPKEFRPVGGRPGLLHVLAETAAAGVRHAVVVHHPYYTPVIDWTRQTLAPGALTRYQQLAQQPVSPDPLTGLRVDFIAQRGRYADITSALNGSQYLRSGHVGLVFCDNVDPEHTAVSELVGAATPGTPAVLAGAFDVRSAPSHGVIICTGTGPVRTMAGLVEKPDPAHAVELAAAYGPDNLGLLLGRVSLTPGILRYMAATARRARTEPRLSIALAAYAQHHRVDVITTSTRMVDLGAPAPAADDPSYRPDTRSHP
ncbi:sugar phosphate nucleotidyltransferase [Streptomyces sp. NPDC046976]|uniref:sugar phosphate nucleotidyltransferase n=1 Tax=Streptomyces sp. NPDC046976 TaxID=3155258 RepID=UPI0033F080AA